MRRLFITFLLAAAVGLMGFATTTQGQDKPKPKEGKKAFPKAEWVDSRRDEPNGTKYQTFTSKAMGGEVSYLIYLPPGYEKETKRYPVIYWLHGMGGNQRGGATVFLPNVEAAIKKGDLPPAIVVLVNGMVTSFYCDWANGKRPVESVIIKDLVPHVDKTYRTIARREARVIQGYSMGGYGAAHLGFKYPELFGTVVVDAGALVKDNIRNGPNFTELYKDLWGDTKNFEEQHPNNLVEKNADKIRGKTLIRVGVGAKDGLLPRSQELHELLEKLKIEHQYEVVEDVAHNGVAYYKKLGSKGFEIHRKAFAALEK
jgi:endo-1,4-beta-xylanase